MKHFVYVLGATIALIFVWALWVVAAHPNPKVVSLAWSVLFNIPMCLAVGFGLGRLRRNQGTR